MFNAEYKKLPNFNKLFLDYVSPNPEDAKLIKSFFDADFLGTEGYQKVIEQKLVNYNSNRYFDKHVLHDILKRQNVTFGASEKTSANIELLGDEKTLAVVTGQQVGLYTGPLYTILKSLTAIKLAKTLKSKFHDYNFIPVFWLEADDHDFDEANHVTIINRENELVRVGYPEQVAEENEEEPKKSLRPVGSLNFDSAINDINAQLRESLMQTDFSEKLFAKISEFYCEGNDFKTAFAQMMNWLLPEYGLIFIDPSDSEIKKLLTPIFEKELATHPRLCESVINTSAELEKNYDLQVKPKVINLFFLHNENRLLIEPRDNNRFALRNSKKRFEQEELMNVLFESPQLFSPNVVLRPICQDYLLPTVAYVGGPAEISYFAQLKPAYHHYDITMPVIFPRVSASILENKINKFFTNFEVKFEEIFDENKLIAKIIDKISEIKLEDEFSKAQDEINRIFYELKNTTEAVDKSLVPTLESVKQKANQSIDIFKGKLANAQTKKNESVTSQIDKVTNNLFPNKNLQERVVNITYFLNKYDEHFIRQLSDEIDVNGFVHQVIEF